MNTRVKLLFAVAVTLFFCLFPDQRATADIIDWNSAEGDWNVAENWTGLEVPTDGDTARVNNGGLLIVSSDAEALNVNLGSTGGLNNRLEISSGFTLTTTSTSNLGQSADQFGTATVNGVWDGSGALYVGGAGTGYLTIASGGSVSSSSGALGQNAGGKGTANILGSWTMSGALSAGSGAASSGDLTVAAGGSTTSSGLSIGNNGTGEVSVFGTMTYTGNNLTVGGQATGNGTLTIEDGGQVIGANNMNIGSAAGSEGTIIIKDGGLFQSTAGSLTVGSSGKGTMTVESGGTMTTFGGNIGTNVGAVGEISVAGTWTSSAQIYIAARGSSGSTGTGSLIVEEGGKVSATVVYLGGGLGGTEGTGNLLVKNNGLLETSSDVQVGTYTSGFMTIEEGGKVLSGVGAIGRSAGSTGTVSVAGLWEMSQIEASDLSVGHTGNGSLVIENGGTVENRIGYIGRSADTTGEVTVKNNGLWQNSGVVNIGSAGTGSLLIENGGQMTSVGSSAIGSSSGGIGSAIIRGTWTNDSGDIRVGQSGQGMLSIGNGGLVNVNNGTGTVSLAQANNNAIGVLNIGGAVVDGTPEAAEGAGTLNASTVTGRNTATVTPLLNFNHTETDYAFENSSGQGIVITTNVKVNVYSGTTSLTAASTYTAGTEVHAGTLLVNNVSGSGTGSGGVLVHEEATLGGAGTLSGATTVDGILSPGNSIGTLAINNNVTWNFNDAWVWELGTAGVDMTNYGISDFLSIGGDFTKGTGGLFVFDFSDTGEEGWYRLVGWNGASGFSESDFLASNLGSGLSGSFVIDSGALYLNVGVIPEPSTVGLAILSFVGLLCAVRRRSESRF